MDSVLQKLLQFEADIIEQEDSAICQWFAKNVQVSMDAATWAHRPAAGTDGESVALLSNLEVPVMIVRLKELKGNLVPTERSNEVSCGYA